MKGTDDDNNAYYENDVIYIYIYIAFLKNNVDVCLCLECAIF